MLVVLMHNNDKHLAMNALLRELDAERRASVHVKLRERLGRAQEPETETLLEELRRARDVATEDQHLPQPHTHASWLLLVEMTLVKLTVIIRLLFTIRY